MWTAAAERLIEVCGSKYTIDQILNTAYGFPIISQAQLNYSSNKRTSDAKLTNVAIYDIKRLHYKDHVVDFN